MAERLPTKTRRPRSLLSARSRCSVWPRRRATESEVPATSTASAASAPAARARPIRSASRSMEAVNGAAHHAASRSAMTGSPGTRPAGPMAASVGAARKMRAAARCTSSIVTASILATVSAVGHHAAEDLHLPGQLLATAAGAFQRHQQAGLHLRAGAGQFGLGHAGLHLAQLLERHRHQLLRLALAGAGIDAEQAAIHVGRGEGIDRIDQPALLPDLLEQARGHAAAQQGGEHHRGVVVRVAIGDRAGKPSTICTWSRSRVSRNSPPA